MISSMHHIESKDSTKGIPEIISFYNSSKGGVDSLNEKCAKYSCARRSRRWPLVIFYRILDIAAADSFILSNYDSANRLMFMKILGKSLVTPHLERRDEASGGGGGGCKVTVVVVREGERVSVLRVLENEDGTYSPLTHHHTYSSSLRSLSEDGVECDSDSGSGGEDGLCAVHENAVTMGKMMELRRRMETLSLQRSSRPIRPHQPRSPRHQNDRRGETQDVMQKTRSEETLAVSSLFEERALRDCRAGSFLCSEPEEGFTPLYDGSYTRLDYDCPFADRYALLPPIGVRADSDHSLRDALDADTLASSLLVKEEAAIIEEGTQECHLPHTRAPPQARTHAPLAHALSAAAAPPPTTADYGPLVSGEASGWRARTFGSSSQLVGGAIGGTGGTLTATGGGGTSAVTSGRLSAGPHSASSLQLRAPPPRQHPPLSDAVFSSSTSDLEALRRNRLLPALSRHPNTEHLHLSDERLHQQRRAPHALEVGSERRQRRVNAALSELAPNSLSPAPATPLAQIQPQDKKSGRMRCALCRRRLTVATVHTCRCGGEFCAPHRYAEAHGCHYDYKALAAARQHPPLAAPKLPKI
ncbi:AN1-type zinc finger protein 4 [Eumeta japonica]|uniref:AN1-type zinc finger protein 4 n=1 Tax=Eumeta variegata TaxID=151549 RepID=A0A4C1TVJ4_EUMVA|nr:AN1-type zinc finger protein 4 [Eumeta japonica]